LFVRWKIYAEAKKWDGALAIAQALVELVPDDSLGWLHRSYALHELKRTQEALDQLLPAAEMFPKDPVIRYNLTCYTCQLGDLERAKMWLEKAFELGDPKKVKLMALEDSGLEPLWKNIGEIK
jgi:tetratricopeptide (TPR) repeat protein